MGHDVETVWQGMLTGKDGFAKTTIFDASTFPSKFGAEVKDYDLSRHTKNPRLHAYANRGSSFVVGAGAQACRQARIDVETDSPADGIDRTRMGIYLGAGEGSVDNDVFFNALAKAWDNDKHEMDWGVRHQEGDPFYFIKGHEQVELQSGGDLLWLYKADGMVEEFNDRMIEEAVQRLIEEHVHGAHGARAQPKIDFLWTTASGAWLIKNTTRSEAYEKVIKNRMDVAFPGMSEEDKRAEAESWFVQNDQLIEIDGELT